MQTKEPVDFYHNVCWEGNCISPPFECDVKFCSGNGCIQNKKGDDMNKKKQPNIPEAGVFEKTCSKCGDEKSILDPETGKLNFYRNPRNKDGYYSWCKVCHNSPRPSRKKLKKEPPAHTVSLPVDPVLIIPEHKCPKCGRILELTLDNFHANPASKTGFKPVCKDCRNRGKRVRRGTEEGCLVLDFTDDMDLFDKVLAAAKKARRKPAMQILAMLEEAV